MALGSYAVWLMFVEAFLWYAGDESLIMGMLRAGTTGSL
jgi:hypothetical protein